MKTLTTLEQVHAAIKTKDTVLIDFYADWCGPCKKIAPKIEELADKYKVYKVNIEVNTEATEEYKIKSIPTFLIFKNGELHERIVGANFDKIMQAL